MLVLDVKLTNLISSYQFCNIPSELEDKYIIVPAIH